MNEVEKMQAVCYWLIEQCRATNADSMTIKQEGVHKLEEKLGDWEIIVRRKKTKGQSLPPKTNLI